MIDMAPDGLYMFTTVFGTFIHPCVSCFLRLRDLFQFLQFFLIIVIVNFVSSLSYFISYSWEESVFSLLVAVFDSRKNVTKNKKC